MAIKGRTSLRSNLTQGTSGIPGSSAFPTNQSYEFKLPNPSGTAGTADNADVRHIKVYSLVSGTPQTINLTSLVDVFGDTFAFARVREVLIANTSEVDGQNLTLGSASSVTDSWTSLVSNPGTLTLPPASSNNDSVFFATAPNTTGWVVGSSNKYLILDPGSNNLTVNVEITGCSV